MATAATTRRTALGRLGKLAAAMAMAAGGAGLPALADRAAAVARDPDREYYVRVFYDKNGKVTKVCYYDKDGTLLYCESR